MSEYRRDTAAERAMAQLPGVPVSAPGVWPPRYITDDAPRVLNAPPKRQQTPMQSTPEREQLIDTLCDLYWQGYANAHQNEHKRLAFVPMADYLLQVLAASNTEARMAEVSAVLMDKIVARDTKLTDGQRKFKQRMLERLSALKDMLKAK